MLTSRFFKIILFLILNFYLVGDLFSDSKEDEEVEEKIAVEIEKVKKQYEKEIDDLKVFYWRFLRERIDQAKIEIQKEKNDSVINGWRSLLTEIEKLESNKEYSKIVSKITLFEDRKIKEIVEDKARLKTYFKKLEADDRAVYEKIRKKENEILLEEFLHQTNALAVASKLEEMRECFLQLIAENPTFRKNTELIEISKVLNVLLASRHQAFLILKLNIGSKLRVKGIEVTLDSFDGETLMVTNYQNQKKTYLFNELHLTDWLTLAGLKYYDGQYIYQNGLKYYLEGQYKKAHEALLLSTKKGINCRTYLLAVESKLGDSQRSTLLEASRFIDQKKFREAEMILERILKENPKDIEALYMQAEIRVGQNRISEAYGLLEDLHKKYPEHEETLRQLAELGYKLKLSDAYLWSQKVLEKNPEDKEHLTIVCKEMRKQENSEKYLEYAIKIQKLNSGLIEPNLLLADAYLYGKKYAEAQSQYEKMLKEKPTQWDAQQGLGEALFLQRRGNEALEYYEKLITTLTSERKKETIRKRIKELLGK